MIHTVAQPWMWAVFIGFVLAMLAVDVLALGGSRAHKVSVREAAAWSIVWVLLALGFDYGLWIYLTETIGREAATTKAMEFLTGYVIEKSLSVDNVFVFLMIFTHFGDWPVMKTYFVSSSPIRLPAILSHLLTIGSMIDSSMLSWR